MPAKRKRADTCTSNRKQSREPEQISLDDSDVYEVLDILRETKTRYLISWAPNKQTGETYEPSWEPKGNVTEEAIFDWERKKGLFVQVAAKSPVEKRAPGRPRRGLARITKAKRARTDPSLQVSDSQLQTDRAPRVDQSLLNSSPAVTSPRRSDRKAQQTEGEEIEESDQQQEGLEWVESPSLSLVNHTVEIEQEPLPLSQQAAYSVHYGSSLTFDSSQVLRGTASDQEEPASSQISRGQLQHLDAAAAPDLTQKHSQFQPVESGESTTDNTTSVTLTTDTSSSLVPHAQSKTSSALVIPDSQSGLASHSYVPSTASKSRSSSVRAGDRTANDDFEDISDWSANSRKVVKQSKKDSTNSLKQLVTVPGGQDISPAPVYDDRLITKPESNKASLKRPLSRVKSAPAVSASINGSLRGSQTITRAYSDEPLHSHNPAAIVISSGITSLSAEEEDLETHLHTPIREQSQVGLELIAPESSDSSEPGRSQPQVRRSPLEPKITNRPTPALASPFRGSKDVLEDIVGFSADTFDGFLTQRNASAAHAPGVIRQNKHTPDHLSIIRRFRDAKPARLLEGQDTLELDSSSLPQPPSHWPDTFNSAPPRLATPSSDVSPPPPSHPRIMSSASPIPHTNDISAKMQELKEAGGPITPAQRSIGMTTRSSTHRAGSPMIAREDRSPSAVPHEERIPMPSDADNRTSERFTTLVPDKIHDAHDTIASLPDGIIEPLQNESPLKTVQTINDGIAEATTGSSVGSVRSNVFAVPLFFLGHQRDSYKQSIVYERKFLEEFLAQAWPADSPMFSRAQALIDKLGQVTSHPDLMNEESFTQAETEPRVKAQWDMDTSIKFRFIGALLAELRGHDLHIIIDVERGRLFDIVDTFLSGIDVQHTKDASRPFIDHTALRITLLGKNDPYPSDQRIDFVIAFEGSAPLIEEERIKSRTRADGSVAPLIYLVVPKTSEHISRYLQGAPYDTMSPNRKLTILVQNAAALRAEAGYRQIHDQDARNSAASIAKYLLNGGKGEEWPIDELVDLVINDPTSDSQATTVSESNSGSSLTSSVKRPLELEDNASPNAKKVRIIAPLSSTEETSTVNPASLSLSAVSDSVERQVVAASEYVSDMESLRFAFEEREAGLHSQVAMLEARLEEHIVALEELQYRYEDQRGDLVKARTERDDAQQTAALAAGQLSTRDTMVSKIKAERETYKTQLAEANAALANHAVPEIVAFEALRAQLATAEKEKTKLETRVKSLTSDLEYIRNLYQEVSGKGAEVAEEKRELEGRVADLERRASDSTRQALLISRDNAHGALRAEIRGLRIEVADRERLLKVKDDEIARLKEKERGRMGTRGGSVPRSPGRLGSPMRLEPPRSHGPGSRAGSPRRGSPAVGALAGDKAAKSKLGR